jgi:hypothetical protein
MREKERTYPTPSIGTTAEAHPAFTIVYCQIAINTTHSHGFTAASAVPLTAVGGAITPYAAFTTTAGSKKKS